MSNKKLPTTMHELIPYMMQLRKEGMETGEIAKHLSAKGLRTTTGVRFSQQYIFNILSDYTRGVPRTNNRLQFVSKGGESNYALNSAETSTPIVTNTFTVSKPDSDNQTIFRMLKSTIEDNRVSDATARNFTKAVLEVYLNS